MYTNSNDVITTIGIVSTSTLGVLNTMTVVTKTSDVTQFGTGNLPDALNVLLRYGLHAVAIRVATGVDATATAANIVGASDAEGLRLLKTAESGLGRQITAVIVPKVQNDSVVTQMVDTATTLSCIGVGEWLGTPATLTTARGTTTGFGIKSKNLAVVFSQPQNANATVVSESAGAHLAGMIGRQRKLYQWGTAPIKSALLNVTSIIPTTTTDTERTNLMNVGVVVTDSIYAQWVFDGYRNALYPSNTGQDSYIMRMLVEQIITTDVRAYLSTRVGLPVNRSAAGVLESEINAYLTQYTSTHNVSIAYARFNEASSDYTTGSLVYDICVTLNAFTGFASITFQVV